MKEPRKFSPSNVLSYNVFYRVNDAKELVQHIQSIHETKVLSQTKKFNNMTKFEQWKQEEGAASIVYFIKHGRVHWINNNMKHIYLYCNRYLLLLNYMYCVFII